MVGEPKPASLDVTEAPWSEAVRREAQVRPLAAGSNSRAAIKAIAARLGLGDVQLYRLTASFRAKPITGTLVVTLTGLNWRTVAKWMTCDTLPERRRMDPRSRNHIWFTAYLA